MSGTGESLRLVDLKLRDFRNYSAFTLEGLGALTAFVGPNAIGKTNIIEAIHMVTAFSSFRSSRLDEMVGWGSGAARVDAHLVSSSRDLDIAVELKPGQKSCLFNGKRKSSQDLQGLLPSVVFSPEDLDLIKGPQAVRRAALDLLGCQLSKNNRIVKRDYEKIVRHKNALLKEEADPALLGAVDAMLVSTGAQLHRYRIALFARLAATLPGIYRSIARSDEKVELNYVPSWVDEEIRSASEASPSRLDEAGLLPDSVVEIEQLLERAIDSRRREEAARRRSVVGPHADRIEVFIGGRNASMFASQGQQRSLVLAWKIAEVELIKEILGTKPLLLLDDVMSELDGSRRRALVDLLLQDIQTFITTTDASFFDSAVLERADVFDLAEFGKVK